ncbi:response regulator transcription factor [Rhizobium tubonense]|uniref:Helix-turn-helix transcriptional regulator n=1 Tax=Rhizobium tubonense TaxID=484088 RepID=A0A2W4CR29_9HYPH|nr:response regulator transcription factor [Rhizobium tubonense]PZM12835.1 helix-turn-helix transcriptional regulator [Rhizobium tubonense]
MSITLATKRRAGRNAPTVIVVEPHTLARTAIVKLLEHELIGWNFIDMVSIESLDRALGMDVRLITIDLGGRNVKSISLLDDLAAITERFSEVPIALLSNTDDVLIASQALTMGIRGFFTISLPIEIALAGLRLVLAGGVFYPHPMGTRPLGPVEHANGEDHVQKIVDGRTNYLSIADFTPREADVLAELQCGCSNKVIAGKLNLSGHTVKMHLQHIMRKLQVQNRTEVVARLGYNASNGSGHDMGAS